MRNAGIRFVGRDVPAQRGEQPIGLHQPLRRRRGGDLPGALHHDGNYQADADTLDRLEGEGRVAFRYAQDVNGSARRIAGIVNEAGNVLGMMPHPERAVEAAHGRTDGRRLFEGLVEALG
jgi:phosphoribosylformylglycinamidine synthase